MLTLGVNIDHVATLRQARYKGSTRGEPCPVNAALVSEEAGAHGITAHLREDRRHIQDSDVIELRRKIATRLNLEMANTPFMVNFALKIRPFIVCLVPEKREEVTTEGGLDVFTHEHSLRQTVETMHQNGIEVSLFIAPDNKQIEAAARTGARYIELHTGAFAEAHAGPSEVAGELKRLVTCSDLANKFGLHVNAGHGLNYENVHLMREVPHLEELNIGHSIISRSVTCGLRLAVQEMLRLIKG